LVIIEQVLYSLLLSTMNIVFLILSFGKRVISKYSCIVLHICRIHLFLLPLLCLALPER